MPSASPPNSPVFDAPADSPGPAPGSDRVFGNFFGALFAGIGAYAFWRGHALGWLGLGLGGVLVALAALAPHSLRRLNRLWLKLGLLLARIVNPLVIGAMFFFVITPMGLLMRAFGKRPLSLRFDPDAVTYWIERSPHGPQPDSMRDQF